MIATWQINTGEMMKVLVTKNFQAFENLINSHPRMKFLSWSTL